MSENAGEKSGLRCHICTGCGLCPGITPGGSGSGRLHILTAGGAPRGERKPGNRELWEKEQEMSGGIEVDPKCGTTYENFLRLVAIDIGTTTVAMLLYDRDGQVMDRYVAVNPQTVYGADVLSRIRVAEKVGADGKRDAAEKMQNMIRGVLETGLARFAKKTEPGEKLLAVVAANTTMNYLFLGRNPKELGCAPFTATYLGAAQTENAGASCLLLPGMSAFVGGDITAGVYGAGMAEKEEITLLIDLGTNGELVLGNCHRRIACATAAGPAFEGGVNRGIWGADMVSLLATLKRRGILDVTGLLAEPYFETGVRIGNVCVTKEAVRAVQLAKAAIAAGIEILLDRYNITAEQVDRVILAGGFGYYLNPEDAAEIGLLPKALVERAVSGGNMALAGSRRVGRELLEEMSANGESWTTQTGLRARVVKQLETLASATEILNLAECSEFERTFVEKLNLE